MQGSHSTRRRVLIGGAALAAAIATGIPLIGYAQTAPARSHTLPPWNDRLPPEKQAFVRQEAQARAAAEAAPLPAKGFTKPHNVLESIPTPVTPLPHKAAGAGTVVEGAQPPFPASQYLVENSWYEQRGNAVTRVYAGVDAQDTAQGLVIVIASSGLNPDSSRSGEYPAPAKQGSVRITGATGERLTLAAARGATFIFDVASRAYVPA